MEWCPTQCLEGSLVDPSSVDSYLLATSGDLKRNLRAGRIYLPMIRLQEFIMPRYEGHEFQPLDIVSLQMENAKASSNSSALFLPITP